MKRILLVEDDDAFASMVSEVVGIAVAGNQPFDVHHVKLVKDALAWLASNRPELILLDLTLPDSYGAATFMRILGEATDVPVVILSGVDDEDMALEALQAGAQDYLVKSRVDIFSIHRSLRYAMERHRLRHELSTQTARIQAREHNLRKLIGHYHDGMIVTDQEHRTLFLNPAAEAMLGSPINQLIGKVIEALPKDGQRTEMAILSAGNAPGIAAVRCLATEWQGERAFLYSLQDVTLLKEADRKLRQSAEELEQRVIHRTAELAGANEALRREVVERQRVEDELRKAIDNLARSNIELERFAYIASHDLREPLRLIINYCDLLRRRYVVELDDAAKTYIQFAIDGANRLYDMINSLLEYSRLNVRTGQFSPTCCNKLLKCVVEELRIGIEESEARITWDVLPVLHANEVLLMQVFQNLIGNAIKFRRQKPPVIHVSAQRQEQAWLFSVNDNGIGMPSEQTDRIFQIFQRLHRYHEYPGSGIGLAICKKIVEHHGGSIWVESNIGEGSSFYFTILDKDARPEVLPPLDDGRELDELRRLAGETGEYLRSVATSADAEISISSPGA